MWLHNRGGLNHGSEAAWMYGAQGMVYSVMLAVFFTATRNREGE